MCTLDDIVYEENLNQQWSVDEEGQQDTFLGDGGVGEFADYLCEGCDTYFENWQEVKEHLLASTIASAKAEKV